MIKVTLKDLKYKKEYNLSKNVEGLEISTYLEDKPGQAEFTIWHVSGSKIKFEEGAIVKIWVDDKPMFKGMVFSREVDETKDKVDVVCYDQMRYLKNKDAMAFENMTSAQIFKQICEELALKYRIVDKSSYKCTPRSEDGSTYFEMIQNALDDTLIHDNSYFFIRDNFGTLEHIAIESVQMLDYKLDGNNITKFSLKTDIDSNTYTQVKLYRDDEEKGKRHVWVINDTKNSGDKLKRWGILQMYEKVDNNLTSTQIKDKAEMLLELYDRKQKTLSITALGNTNLCAGTLVTVNITGYPAMNIVNKQCLVTECTHKFEPDFHTMELKLDVPN